MRAKYAISIENEGNFNIQKGYNYSSSGFCKVILAFEPGILNLVRYVDSTRYLLLRIYQRRHPALRKLHLFKYYDAVMAAKTKRIAHHNVYVGFDGISKNDVHIAR